MSKQPTQKKSSFKITALITPLIVLCLTSFVLKETIQGIDRVYIEDEWMMSEGVILDPSLHLTGKKNVERRMMGIEQVINYEYTVAAVTYQSNAASKEAYVLFDQFPEGKQVPVYYNPRDVTESVLVRSEIQKAFTYVIILLCLFMMSMICAYLVRDFKSR
ncbi:MAG: hypothetical protein ACI9F2_001002 [Lysobacterales bacterium]|jgi:hypothetical protein